ncbi:unnamed protein product [Xylocopa violacea]|uniref:Amine oxidase domain-containing protein n=1 Tax=Xylocopa violacea TaxID=135666 RepID=A0ABP1NLD9_XYLVO
MTAILGAGMSGLSAAYYALKTSKVAPLVVLEATNRVGGWVRSIKQPDGTIFEKGPRIIRANYQNILHALWKDLTTSRVSKDDESIYSFMERRFGRDIAEKIAAPILCGICGGDIHELSAKSFMPKLVEFEKEHGSVFKVERAKKEAWNMWGLQGGFEQLPQALAQNIAKRGVNIKMENNCEQIIFNKNSVELTVNGKVEKYSHVISSLPAKNLADLVQEQHPELSKELLDIPTVTIAVAYYLIHLLFLKTPT